MDGNTTANGATAGAFSATNEPFAFRRGLAQSTPLGPSSPSSNTFNTNSGGAFPLFPSKPFAPCSEKPAEVVVHDGVTCDFCEKKNIRGVRYKCVECSNVDRCSACMSSPKAWASHDSTHHFFPIEVRGNFTEYNVVKQRLPPSWNVTHHGVNCDGCGRRDFAGVRNKCLFCDDYDLCETCVLDPQQRLKHFADHPLFPMTTLFNRTLYDTARKDAEARRSMLQHSGLEQAVHANVNCDLCQVNPIIGVRHKCLDCADYDVCTTCLLDPKMRQQHNVTHAFFPIPNPTDHSQYSRALLTRVRLASEQLAASRST